MNARPPSLRRPVHVWLAAAVLSCANLLPVPAAEKDDVVTAAMRDALYAEEVK